MEIGHVNKPKEEISRVKMTPTVPIKRYMGRSIVNDASLQASNVVIRASAIRPSRWRREWMMIHSTTQLYEGREERRRRASARERDGGLTNFSHEIRLEEKYRGEPKGLQILLSYSQAEKLRKNYIATTYQPFSSAL